MDVHLQQAFPDQLRLSIPLWVLEMSTDNDWLLPGRNSKFCITVGLPAY